MSKFENKLCPVCRERFRESDEIVVCPDCGTPHHRSCYLSENKCALEVLHGEGFVWNGRLPDEPETVVVTPPEEAENRGASQYDVAENPENGIGELPGMDAEGLFEFLSMMSDDTVDGVNMHELMNYTAYSLLHYRMAFAAIRGYGGKRRKTFFNICSGLFAPIFQFYRKMEFFGVIVLLVMTLPPLALAVATHYVTIAADTLNLLYSVINIINAAEMVLLCIFGDYIYYRHAIKRIRKIRESFGGERTEEYYQALTEQGMPSYGRALLGLLAFAFAEACVLAVSSHGMFI